MGEFTSQKMTIEQAGDADIGEISSILLEAVVWLTESGMRLWTEGVARPDLIGAAVDRGEFYLARVNGVAVGTFILQWEDPVFWPDVPRGESAVIHRLAVRRSVAGTGVAAGILSWAGDRAKIEGKKYLRLDCAADRPKLRAVYEDAGFKYHSDWQMPGFVVARYQIELI